MLERAGEPLEGVRALFVMNHENGGFDCPGCAWPDDPTGSTSTSARTASSTSPGSLQPAKADREFFAAHTVSELAGWSDYDLEAVGRLAEPMSYNPASDKYEPISWEDAFALVGDTLRGAGEPAPGVILHLRAAQQRGDLPLPALGARVRHEQPAGLLEHVPRGQRPGADGGDRNREGHRRPATTGQQADAIWLMGDNAATNAPRMLTWLAEADRRGAQLVHINPLIEAASRRTIVPHEFVDMATFHTTEIGTMNVQVRIGGDMALLRGVAKAVLEAAEKDPAVLDREFIEYHTHGFDEYRALVESTPWSDLVQGSGVAESDIRKLADSYMASKRVIIAWCLGITQHEHGVDTVREIVNLLLLRGNIGREGAGPCPIRGHSNVQGNRTCGIDHRPDAAFLDRLAEVCGIDPPREHGLGTVATIEAMHRGDVKVFVALGGNFALATPDLAYTAEALRNCELTVQVSTKLNRSHSCTASGH